MKNFIRKNWSHIKSAAMGLGIIGVTLAGVNYQSWMPADLLSANVFDQTIECYYETYTDKLVACGDDGCVYPDGSFCDDDECVDSSGMEISAEALDEFWEVDYKKCLNSEGRDNNPPEKIMRNVVTEDGAENSDDAAVFEVPDYSDMFVFEDDNANCYAGYNDEGTWCEEICEYEDGSNSYDGCNGFELEEEFKNDCEIYYENGRRCEKCPDSSGRYYKTCSEVDRCSEFTNSEDELCTVCYDFDGEIVNEYCTEPDGLQIKRFRTPGEGAALSDIADQEDVIEQKIEMEEMLDEYDGRDWNSLLKRLEINQDNLEDRLEEINSVTGQEAKGVKAALELAIGEIGYQIEEVEKLLENLDKDREEPEVFIRSLEPGESSYEELEESWNKFAKLDAYGALYEALELRANIEEMLHGVWEIRAEIAKIYMKLELDETSEISLEAILKDVDELMEYRTQARDLYRALEVMMNDVRSMSNDIDASLEVGNLLKKGEEVKELRMEAEFGFDKFWEGKPWQVIDALWREDHAERLEGELSFESVYEGLSADELAVLEDKVDSDNFEYVLKNVNQDLVEDVTKHLDEQAVETLINNLDVLGDKGVRVLDDTVAVMERLNDVKYEELTLKLQNLYRRTENTLMVSSMWSEIAAKWDAVQAAVELDDYERFDELEAELTELLDKNDKLAAKGDDAFTFLDTPIDQWYFESLIEMREKGFISGYKDGQGNITGEFKPDNKVTLGEALKMLIEAAGLEVHPQGDDGHWAVNAGYVNAAQEIGLNGLVDLSNLDDAATREELAVMVAEIFRLDTGKVYKNVFLDYNGQFGGHIQAVYEAGIFTGEGDTGLFNGDDFINRAAMVKVMKKAMETEPVAKNAIIPAVSIESPEAGEGLMVEEGFEVEDIIKVDSEPAANAATAMWGDENVDIIKVFVDGNGQVEVVDKAESEEDAIIDKLIEGALEEFLEGDGGDEELQEELDFESIPKKIKR